MPLTATSRGLFNFICEVPKYTAAKFQVDTTDPCNPIKQQCTRDGVPKRYPRSLTFNHGAFPRTWTSPGEVYPGVGYGDNDMVDVVEIGMASVRHNTTTGGKFF